MKKILLLLVLLLIPFVTAQESSFSVILETDGNNLELISIDLYNVKAPTKIEENYELIAQINSFNNEPLYSFDFTKEIHILDADFKLEKRLLNLVFPYFINAKEMIIINRLNNQTIMKIDLTEFQSCNFNGICEFNENKINCPEDCKIGEEIQTKPSSEQINDTIAKKSTKIDKKSETDYNTILVILIIITTIIILILVLKKKNNRKIYK